MRISVVKKQGKVYRKLYYSRFDCLNNKWIAAGLWGYVDNLGCKLYNDINVEVY